MHLKFFRASQRPVMMGRHKVQISAKLPCVLSRAIYHCADLLMRLAQSLSAVRGDSYWVIVLFPQHPPLPCQGTIYLVHIYVGISQLYFHRVSVLAYDGVVYTEISSNSPCT